MASYGLTLGVTWAFMPMLPTYEEAFAHAALSSTLGGPLIAYIVAIYAMKPEHEDVCAFRKGLFSDLKLYAKKQHPNKLD